MLDIFKLGNKTIPPLYINMFCLSKGTLSQNIKYEQFTISMGVILMNTIS